MLEKFDPKNLMAGPLGDWLGHQANLRRDAKRIARKRLLIGLAILIVPSWALIFLVPLEYVFELRLSLVTASFVFLYGWSQRPKDNAIGRVKIGINEALAKALGASYSINVVNLAPFERAKAFELFPDYDQSALEDQWEGHASGHPFCLHEVNLLERRRVGKVRTMASVFRGLILTLKFTKEFHGTTVIQRKGANGGWFGNSPDSIELAGRHLSVCEMVHPAFDDAFEVYSTDAVEARYLVHPTYVERLIALEQVFDGQKLRGMFHHGELLVLLESENMFESGSIRARDDEARLTKTLEQFQRLAELAAILNEREEACSEQTVQTNQGA